VKLPNESSSSWVHIGFAAFTWASLNAWSEFPDLPDADKGVIGQLSASLKASIDSLVKEARETQDQQIFGRPIAQAKQNASLTLLRRRVGEALAMVAFRIGGGEKNHPAVREFLPNLMTTITRARISARPQATSQAAGRLKGLSQGFAEKAELAQRLEDAAALAQSAVDDNATAGAAWTQERSEELVAKGRLRLELERAHRALGAQFPGQRDFVESFFLKGDRPSEGTEDEEASPAPTDDTKPA
jgi:hypothetical protein